MKPARLTEILVAALRGHLAGAKPQIPEAGQLVWGFFCELSSGRTYGFAGPNPISFVEIEAWARLHRWPLQQHHIATIRALDRVWIAHAQARQAKDTPPALTAGQAINPGAFDAVFG